MYIQIHQDNSDDSLPVIFLDFSVVSISSTMTPNNHFYNHEITKLHKIQRLDFYFILCVCVHVCVCKRACMYEAMCIHEIPRTFCYL